MKMKRVLALFFAVGIILSGCAEARMELGSQPGASSPTSFPTTAPDPSDAAQLPVDGTEPPPAPIKQDVTPKASFVWNGDPWSQGRWEIVDLENTAFTDVQFEYLQPLDTMQPVYYDDYIPAVLETFSDDTYVWVNISTHPTVFSLYGAPDGSEEYYEMLRTTCAELRRRLEEAGYPIYFEEDSWYYDFGREEPTDVVTIMSVAEMKALHCGDDLSVVIHAQRPAQIA